MEVRGGVPLALLALVRSAPYSLSLDRPDSLSGQPAASPAPSASIAQRPHLLLSPTHAF